MVSRENKLVLSVKDTAILLSSNPEQIREAIDNGTFSFGRCITSGNNKKIYKIEVSINTERKHFLMKNFFWGGGGGGAIAKTLS